MGPAGWVPEIFDPDSVSPARVYDYMLGGSQNFVVDREVARRGIDAMPDLPIQAQANRAFLHRAVRWLTAAGVRQFLDVGSGIPTRGNLHEVAQRAAPESRVVYVDIDPIAVSHARDVLAGNDRAVAVQEDMRRPETIVDHPDVRELLDFNRPVAVLLLATLHAVPDDGDPYGIVSRLCAKLPAGGYLAVSHASHESRPEVWERMVEIAREHACPLTPRGRAEVERFFTGFELVDPGVVWAPQWHPEHPDDLGDDPAASSNLVGVGRKR